MPAQEASNTSVPWQVKPHGRPHMTALPETLIALKGFVVTGWLIAFFVLERIRPAAEHDRLEGCGPPSRLRRLLGDPARLLRNGCLWFVNVAGGSLIVVPITAWAGG
jgi:hypothetical protein